MLNAPRPRRPSLSTAQPADPTVPTSSFRYSTSRPRFSTNPSSTRRTSGSQEPVSVPLKVESKAMAVDDPIPQQGWTEGQYPGPPLPARPGAGVAVGSGLTQLPPTPADTSVSGKANGGSSNSSNNTGRDAAVSHATASTDRDRAVPMDVEVDTSTRTTSSRTNRRPLPPRPHPPAADQIPAWEPDLKPHIPPNVTLDSRHAAYTTIGNPPPLLRSAVQGREDPKRERAGMLRRPAVNGVVILQEGPKGGGGGGSLRDRKGKGKAKVEIGLGTENKGGIAGEYVLDPSLPFALPDDAVDLSQNRTEIQGGIKRKRGSIDGERPSAIFKTEGGDVDLRLSVVNEETMRGDDMSAAIGAVEGKRVKKARVEVTSVRGHVRVDLVKIDKGRSVSIEISSRAGNLFIQIPENFRGPVHCSTSAAQPTILLPLMRQRAKILSTHRGETTCYLGTQPPKKQDLPPLLPPRRFSNRLRERTSGSSLTTLPEYSRTNQNQDQVFDSPPPMDVDGFRMPSPSQMAHFASSTFIPTSNGATAAVPEPGSWVRNGTAGSSQAPQSHTNADDPPESSLYLSSYMGAITLGIYGREPEATFKGATTLSGLVQNLGDIKGEMKRKVREKVGL